MPTGAPKAPPLTHPSAPTGKAGSSPTVAYSPPVPDLDRTDSFKTEIAPSSSDRTDARTGVDAPRPHPGPPSSALPGPQPGHAGHEVPSFSKTVIAQADASPSPAASAPLQYAPPTPDYGAPGSEAAKTQIAPPSSDVQASTPTVPLAGSPAPERPARTEFALPDAVEPDEESSIPRFAPPPSPSVPSPAAAKPPAQTGRTEFANLADAPLPAKVDKTPGG